MKNKIILIIVLILLSLSGIIIKRNTEKKENITEIKKTNTHTNMKIRSSAFENGNKIPMKYTCDGKDINPPLEFLETPPQTKSLALIVDDPDSPSGNFVHWIIWNINPKTTEISEDSIPEGSTQGTNSFGNIGYGGPCPGSGEHRYIFTLYALDTTLSLNKETEVNELKNAMENHILDQITLIGKYMRK